MSTGNSKKDKRSSSLRAIRAGFFTGIISLGLVLLLAFITVKLGESWLVGGIIGVSIVPAISGFIYYIIKIIEYNESTIKDYEKRKDHRK